MHLFWELAAYLVMGCSIGVTVADLELRRWGPKGTPALVGLLAAGVCVVALVG